MIDGIESNSEWVDTRGQVITVVSVNKDAEEIKCKRAGSDRYITVALDVFKQRLLPYNSDQAVENKKSKGVPVAQSLVDDAPIAKVGGSLQLSSMDWLERGMHAKTVKFDIGQGGLPPEVTWEDKCAAIATIGNAAAKSLATILLWGNDNNWNWSGDFDTVVHHLAGKMLEQCRHDGQGMPKGYAKTLQELARLMGRMTLYFELYQLWDFYTVKGRLAFCGIDVNHRTYSNQFLEYQRLMLDELGNLVGLADSEIANYRSKLRR